MTANSPALRFLALRTTRRTSPAWCTIAACAVLSALPLIGGCETTGNDGRTSITAVSPPRTLSEKDFLEHHVQLTFADQFTRAGEAYFDPSARWIIFQATPVPPAGEAPSPHYAMYAARLQYSGEGRVTGIDTPIELSPPGSANTCGWFHPTKPGVVLFGSTMTEPQASDAPGYSRDRSRYTWQFPDEMNIVTMTVPQIVRDLVTEPAERAALLARHDVGRPVPLFERHGYDAEGSWSSCGRWILLTSVDTETGDGHLWAYIMETGERRPLVIQPGYDGGPFISPCGRYICYRSDRVGNNLLQLFVSELAFDDDGLPTGIRREYQLTDNEDVNWAPYWHPSGDYLVYASSEVSHFNYEIFAIPFDRAMPEVRGRTMRITEAEGFDGLPVFSPDGGMLMWTAQRGSDRANDGRPTSQIWIADVRHERPAGMRLPSERMAAAVPGDDAAGDPIAAALAMSDPDVRRYNEHVVTLANPFLEGRLPGTRGIEIAEEYIAWWFERAGLTPAFPTVEITDDGTEVITPRSDWFQPFEMVSVSGMRPTEGAPGTGGPIIARNVGGILPGRGALANEYIVVGAHHDHLGTGTFGSRTGAGPIHPGADDNASGVAGLLILADRLVEQAKRAGSAPRRSILFMTFSAEESGLNGASHYVENPIVPLDRHVLMINFDMIGRIEGRRLTLAGVASGDSLASIVEPLAARSPLTIEMPETLPGRSDHMVFYRRNIPVLFAMISDFHEEYHTPADKSWLINRLDATRTARFAGDVIMAVARAPQRPVFAAIAGADAQDSGPSMRALRIRFGITPGNYNDPRPGISVQAVADGTSAANGGVLAGDRMTHWNGREITGISEWMIMMGDHEPGDVVTIIVDRDGRNIELTVTLQAR